MFVEFIFLRYISEFIQHEKHTQYKDNTHIHGHMYEADNKASPAEI